jgi:hypothetical protein
MTTLIQRDGEALMSALLSARENEKRWLEMSQESLAGDESLEQWANIARLRRLEVERIETLLEQMTEDQRLLQFAGCKDEDAGMQ